MKKLLSASVLSFLLFGALTFSIQQSYKFLKQGIIDGSDKEAIRFIQRIRNDQNSLLKKIAIQYYDNKSKGLTISTALDTGETGEIIDSYVNDTSQVEAVVHSIVLPILTNGINLSYVEACAKMVEELGGEVVKIIFLMELAGLKGREKLQKYDVESVIIYPGK